jgi:hypothetical protein
VSKSNGYECRTHNGGIQFTIRDSLYFPSVVVKRITANLGVFCDSHAHNGMEYSWDLPGERRMFLCLKDWGETRIGLIDFKAQ